MPRATDAATPTELDQHVDALAQDVAAATAPEAPVPTPQSAAPAVKFARSRPAPDRPADPDQPVDNRPSKARSSARDPGHSSDFALEGDFESPEAIATAPPPAPAPTPAAPSKPSTTDQWSTESGAPAPAPAAPAPGASAPAAAPAPAPTEPSSPAPAAPAAPAGPVLIARRTTSAPATDAPPSAAPPAPNKTAKPAPSPATPTPGAAAPPAPEAATAPRISLAQRARPIVSTIALPLSRLSPTVRRAIGWVAINSAFLAICVWLYIMLFR